METAIGVGMLGNKNIKPLYYGGHCYYVRKTIRGEQMGREFWDRHEGGILIPQEVADRSSIVEVLAKGPSIGTKCSKLHSRKYQRARWIEDAVQPGDLLMIPHSNDPCAQYHDTRIKRSPLAEYEFFIEESLPLAILKQEAINAYRNTTTD